MKSAPSISHFVINIIYFFNVIQHFNTDPPVAGRMDGWIPLIIKHNIDFEFATCITSSAPLKCLCMGMSDLNAS